MRLIMTLMMMLVLACYAQDKELKPAAVEDWLGGMDSLTLSDAVFTVKGSRALISKNILPVVPQKKYWIGGYFRLAEGCESTQFYLGLVPMDEERRRISPENVVPLPDSESELSRPYNARETVLWIKANEKWQPDRVHVVAFGTDMPNFSISPGNIVKVESAGAEYKVTLSKPSPLSYPAATRVRIHKLGAHYIYVIPRPAGATNEWRPFNAIMEAGDSAQFGDRKFPAATRNARIVILANYGLKDAAMEFKDVTLKELP